jgi:hypothetical protein
MDHWTANIPVVALMPVRSESGGLAVRAFTLVASMMMDQRTLRILVAACMYPESHMSDERTGSLRKGVWAWQRHVQQYLQARP